MSTIRIYQTEILPEKNALVDSLTDYLNSLTPTITRADIQYIKEVSEIGFTLKLDVDQSYVSTVVGNYLDLLQDNKHFYYFILGSRWLSKSAVELELELDTLNTFRSDLSFNAKTQINRQHKDRYIVKPRYTFTPQTVTSGTYSPTIKYNVNFEDKFSQRLLSATSNILTNFTNGHAIILDEFNNLLTEFNFDQIDYYDIANQDYDIIFISNHTIVYSIAENDVYNFFRAKSIATTGTISNATELSNYCDSINGYWTYNNYNIKVIDKLSEGASPIKYHDNSEDVIIREPVDNNFYLIYKNKNELSTEEENLNNPVECYLTCDYPYIVQRLDQKYSGVWPAREFYSSPGAREVYYLSSDENPSLIINFKDYNGTFKSVDLSTGNIIVTIIGSLQDGRYFYSASILRYDSNWAYLRREYVEAPFSTINNAYIEFIDASIMRKSTTSTTDHAAILTFDQDDRITTNYQANIITIDGIDRTDSKIIKIIKLPYAPTGMSLESGVLIYDTATWQFQVGSRVFKLTDLNIKFNNEFETESNPMQALISTASATLTDLRNDDYECKLLHSDFYNPKFVYDSFNLGLALEQININKYVPGNLKVKFNSTSTINSRYLFTFPQYVLNNSTSDYDNIIYVNRNNEEVLYNSAYISYIRNGYNYDKKSKDRAAVERWATFGIDVATSIASFVLGGGLGKAVGIAKAGATIVSLVSNINKTIDAEESLQTKLQELRNEAVSVSGADDVDLLDVYSKNRMKICYYKVSEQMKKQFGDLFYYCGYIENKQEVPNLNTRTWFNYIQCSPVFNSSSVYTNFINDIKAKYSIGVTVYHKQVINGINIWDWTQHYENWETSMIS